MKKTIRMEISNALPQDKKRVEVYIIKRGLKNKGEWLTLAQNALEKDIHKQTFTTRSIRIYLTYTNIKK